MRTGVWLLSKHGETGLYTLELPQWLEEDTSLVMEALVKTRVTVKLGGRNLSAAGHRGVKHSSGKFGAASPDPRQRCEFRCRLEQTMDIAGIIVSPAFRLPVALTDGAVLIRGVGRDKVLRWWVVKLVEWPFECLGSGFDNPPGPERDSRYRPG